MTETFDYAFGEAGLDFITLTDYVTDSAWGEIGRHRATGKLVGRSSEVITYRGHTNNQLSGRFVDYRTGPVYDLRPDGGVALRRAARPASRILRAVRRAGGFTQINHPTIFPSSNPLFAMLCRGCPWDYSRARDALPARRRDRGQHRARSGSARRRTRSPRPRSTSTRPRWPAARTPPRSA